MLLEVKHSVRNEGTVEYVHHCGMPAIGLKVASVTAAGHETCDRDDLHTLVMFSWALAEGQAADINDIASKVMLVTQQPLKKKAKSGFRRGRTATQQTDPAGFTENPVVTSQLDVVAIESAASLFG